MRLCIGGRSGLRMDSGSTLVEVAVGAFVIAVAVTGVVGSMVAGMGLVGSSRQRTSGAAVAQERIERAHNSPFDNLALKELPVHSTIAGHPDAAVNGSADKPYYQVDATHNEPLIVDTSQGTLLHIDDPIMVGQTEFTIYQYVTWVDDLAITKERDSCPLSDKKACDYKRVIVVVRWKFPVNSSLNTEVVESTFIGDGTVSLPETGPGVGGPGATSSPAATFAPPELVGDLLGIGGLIFPAPPQEPNPDGPCPADTQGPTADKLAVASGAGASLGYVKSVTVQLQVIATDMCTVPDDVEPTDDNEPPNDINAYFSNCGDAPPPTPTPTPEASPTPTPTGGIPTPTPVPCDYTDVGMVESAKQATITWSIPAGDGRRRIYARFKDANGLLSGTYGVDVILDQTPPTTPGNLHKVSVSCSGSDRTVTMGWNAATDENFVGYRYYRSVDLGPYVELGTTSSLQATDPTEKKTRTSVRYIVRGYDKAGNESSDSNELSLAKNECS